MIEILNQIKWAYQRVRYGYDDRIYWGFDSHIRLILKPLREFCEDYLQIDGGKRAKLNPERAEIFGKTIELIKKVQHADFLDDEEELTELAEYFGKNIGWYWDSHATLRLPKTITRGNSSKTG